MQSVQLLSDAEVLTLSHDWSLEAREAQIPPAGMWRVWVYLGGRGVGKTRTGGEFIRSRVKAGCKRIGLIAPTAADARDVMVEGVGGLMSVCWGGDRDNEGELLGRPVYEPSKRRVTWRNRAIATLYSAEEPDRLRGPQHDTIWADELAAWFDPQGCWDMAMFGLRMGQDPRAMVTTTPRPIPLLRELVNDKANTVVSRETTYANRANLAPGFFDQIIKKYEGTRLGRQELNAEILEESDQALWNRDMIEQARLKYNLPPMRRVVVGVDPAITHKAESNLTGIVACGLGIDGLGYVLADSSGRFSPDGWARKAVELYHKHRADRIVAEGNQGGEMVRHTINSVMPNCPVQIVHASRGKQARAEPVAALYEQNKVRHAYPFPELEQQMLTWEPLGDEPSPDRIDALVWALTSLMVVVQEQASVATYGSV